METVRSTPAARKKHHCEVCGWDIEPGEKYERTVTFDGGDVLTWKAHISPCGVATGRAHLDGYDDCGLITADGVAAWAEEHAAPDDAEAAELRRRLTINHERWREKRAAEIRER
jgi:hypothetical protein